MESVYTARICGPPIQNWVLDKSTICVERDSLSYFVIGTEYAMVNPKQLRIAESYT